MDGSGDSVGRASERMPDGWDAGTDGRRFAVDLVRAGSNDAASAGRGLQGRAPARLVVAVWVLGLAGVIGIAALGRFSGSGDQASGLAVAPRAAPGAELLESTSSDVAAPAQPGTDPGVTDAQTAPDALIVVFSPATGEPTITSGELIVQGSVHGDADALTVIVDVRGRQLVARTVQPAVPDEDGSSTRQRSRFLVRLQLPDPRPIGPMVLEVAAFDRSGARLAVIRRPFQLGRVDRPTLGDDGLLGGIVFSGG
jgi:hypothetical protein